MRQEKMNNPTKVKQARALSIYSTYRILYESLVFLLTGAASSVLGNAVEPVRRRRRRRVVVAAAHAVDAEHEERADDGRDAGGEERGGVFARAVVDPAWRDSKGD